MNVESMRVVAVAGVVLLAGAIAKMVLPVATTIPMA